MDAARLAPANAAHWFGAALRLEPANAPAEERIELLFARARALTAVGRLDDSRSTLLEALDLVPDGADVLRARLARACAGVETNSGCRNKPVRASSTRLRSSRIRAPARPWRS